MAPRAFVSLVKATLQDWSDDKVPRAAAALAYYAVFSLAPLLLIAIGIAGIVFGREQAQTQILAQATSLVGEKGAQAIEMMMGAKSLGQQTGIISTVIGAIALLIGAAGVLAQLKDTLNTVWDVKAPKTGGLRYFLKTYFMNIALVFATGFLLLVSLIIAAAVGAATDTAHDWLAGPDVLWFGLDAAFGLAMTTVVFALIFKYVPDADVRWRDVWLGALVTSVLFTAGRIALGAYLGREGGDSAYGAAGSILALLAWVYYAAQLVLFGAEFTHADAERRGRVSDKKHDDAREEEENSGHAFRRA
jgi:membrane protein